MSRYEFLEAPRTLEEFAIERGIVFRHGRFITMQSKRPVVIGEMRVYNSGVVVDSATDTDILEEFIKQLMDQATDQLGIEFDIKIDSSTYYSSQLEFLLYISDPDKVKEQSKADNISSLLNSYLEGYNIPTTKFHHNVGTFDVDPLDNPGGLIGHFSISRRAGFPYGNSMYFSEAPLKTRDHQAALVQILDLLG
jgi:hypothetical protein